MKISLQPQRISQNCTTYLQQSSQCRLWSKTQWYIFKFNLINLKSEHPLNNMTLAFTV